MEHRRIVQLGVLAGAYRGRVDRERRMVDHYLVEGDEHALCGYAASRLADVDSGAEAAICPKCLARLDRMIARGAAKAKD